MKILSDLVDIRSGYTFRTALDSYEVGDTEVVQAGDLNEFFSIVARPMIAFPGSEGHLLQPGDVLLSARGFAKAVVWRGEGKRAVVSSSLFVLRPKSIDVDSSFIAMFFNSIPGIKVILKLSSGASVQSVRKTELENVEIPELPPDKAKALGRAVQVIDDYQELLSLKKTYLDNLRSTIISKNLKETTK